MASLPPPWLAKAMNVPVEDRIRFHEEASHDTGAVEVVAELAQHAGTQRGDASSGSGVSSPAST